MRLNRLAEIISWVTTPFLVLIVSTFLLVLNADVSQFLKATTFILIVVSLPMVILFYQYLKGREQVLDPNVHERNYLYFAGVFSSLLATLAFGSQLFNDPFWFNMSMLMAIYFGLFYLVNRYFDKASFHLGSLALSVMLLADQLSLAFSFLFIIFPVLIWARFRLRRHTWVEILWGWVIGLSVGLLAWTIGSISS
jgi:hypothetical protein